MAKDNDIRSILLCIGFTGVALLLLLIIYTWIDERLPKEQRGGLEIREGDEIDA